MNSILVLRIEKILVEPNQNIVILEKISGIVFIKQKKKVNYKKFLNLRTWQCQPKKWIIDTRIEKN